MAQDPATEAAKPLLDLRDKIYGGVIKAYDYLNNIYLPGTPSPKPDTSWHDKMVQEANASFVKAKPTTSHTAGQKRLSSKYGSKTIKAK